jgi:hypothetical protein
MMFDTPITIAFVEFVTLCGYKTKEHMASMRTKLHKMSVAETGGLLYVLKLLLDKPNMITSNIDIDDGLDNGAVGTLKYVEWDDDLSVKRVWLLLQPNAVGKAARIKAHPYGFVNPGFICSEWTPLTDILALTEKWIDRNKTVPIDGYKSITQFKGLDVRAGGVTIYENKLCHHCGNASSSHKVR